MQLKYNVTERYAASTLGINHNTLISRRNRGIVPFFCYQKRSCGDIRYNLVVLKRYLLDPTNEKANALAISHHKRAYWTSIKASPKLCVNLQQDINTPPEAMTPLDLLFDTSEKDMAAILGISRWSLRDRRQSGFVSEHCYIRFGTRLIRYNRSLTIDWSINPLDTLSQARALAVFEASRISSPSNLAPKP